MACLDHLLESIAPPRTGRELRSEPAVTLAFWVVPEVLAQGASVAAPVQRKASGGPAGIKHQQNKRSLPRTEKGLRDQVQIKFVLATLLTSVERLDVPPVVVEDVRGALG